MRNRLTLLAGALAALAALAVPRPTGGLVEASPPDASPHREVLVPFDDLSVLLEDGARRVLLTRAEYEALRALAEERPHHAAPVAAAIIAADYQATLGADRAEINGTIVIDVLEDGVHAVPLRLAGVGLRAARLDEAAAPIGAGDDGVPVVFVTGTGRHRLGLDLVAPLATDSARQTLSLQVPTPAATRFALVVPGDVEVESVAGGAVASRVVAEGAAPSTRFELLTAPGDVPLSIGMTLNSRTKRSRRSVATRSVVVSELTEAYEKLHAVMSVDVLHRAVDHVRFEVPAGFELTDVTSPALAAWTLEATGPRPTLDVRLREATTGRFVLRLSAVRPAPGPGRWRMPAVRPLDVVSAVSVVGLVVEDRLTVGALETDGLIPIDAAVLRRAMPSATADALVRPIAAFYAPQAAFGLSATIEKPPAALLAMTNVLLTLEETGHQARGGITLVPQEEKLFDFAFVTGAGWHVTSVTGADNAPLPFERLGEAGTRVRVRLPRGVAPGEETLVYFHARRTPAGWLDAWETKDVDLPVFPVEGAATDRGAVAVAAADDLMVRATTLDGLTPLDEGEKQKFGLAGVATDLAYRYEQPAYRGAIEASRIAPRITARTLSFLRVEPDARFARYEIIYDVQRARTRELALLLPAGTPQALSITGLDGVTLKGFTSEPAEREGKSMRRWVATLTEARRGAIRLAVDFQQRVEHVDGAEEDLPIATADGVAYQSGLVAVEGSAELDVEIVKHPRRVDVGELVDAEYEPGRRLLGAFGFVGDPPRMAIAVERPPAYAPVPAIVERAHLTSAVAASGVSQTLARFELRTKSLFLEIHLPEGATLWGATLDGQPTKPQRDGERLLLDLPPAPEGAAPVRRLEVVYEAPIDAFGLLGRSTLPAPELRFHAGRGATGAGVAVPVADTAWDVSLPPAYRALASEGTMITDQITPTRLAVVDVARWLLALAGGVPGPVNPVAIFAPELAQVTAATGVDSAESEMALDAMAPRRELSKKRRPPVPATAGVVTESYAAKEVPLDDLLGVRSLDIALDRSGPSIHFQSFGDAPVVDVTVANVRRLEFLAAATGLIVLIIGLTRGRSLLGMTRFVVVVGVVATALAVVTGHGMLTYAANAAFYAVAALVPLVLGLSAARWLTMRLRAARMPAGMPAGPTGVATGLLVLASLVGTEPTAHASDPVIAIPDDVIIVPYVAETEEGAPIVPALGADEADQLLLPYALFAELWNRAHPERTLVVDAPPVAYALAGGAFAGSLPAESALTGGSDEAFLDLAGHLEIDVFVDEPVAIPLALGGGVLAKARLDERPARLTMNDVPAPAGRRQAPDAGTPRRPMTLHVVGRGRHRLELAVRLPLERRGGWRSVRGVLPIAPATALTIRVPEAGTDVRLGGVDDRRTYETAGDDEAIRTAAPRDGTLAIDWRPKVSQGAVDLSLRAESSVVLDVREDGLRAVWDIELAFPRGERETFSLSAPEGFLVERVEGANVRGWDVTTPETGPGLIDVVLLQPARNVEHVRVHLRRDEAIATSRDGGEPYRFSAPIFDVGGAALQGGTILVRRSPMLHVRTLETTGATRLDVSEFSGVPLDQLDDESPMGTRPYEAYRFTTTAYALDFETDPVVTRTAARLQTILRIAERRRRVETRIELTVRDRPVHAVRLLVPADLDVESVVDAASGREAEWSITPADGRERRLSVFLPDGRRGAVPLVVQGDLGPVGVLDSVPLPRFEVVDVAPQTGHIVVQVDPAFDATPRDLVGCQTAFLKNVTRWLKPGQQRSARLVVYHGSPKYAGRVELDVRQPDVSCYTVTNVRVTDRAIEDTLLLDFTIRQAGVRRLVFLAPEDLANATVSVPHLRSRSVTPAGDHPGYVRFVIELEDEIMEHVRVLLEHDRLLTTDAHRAPIPIVETGRTDRRYVALENTGRDEAVVQTHVGLDPLGRQQREWQEIAPLVQGGSTTAFIVAPGAVDPALTFQTTQRQIVQTAGARIGLADTRLACDANGTYRAQQTYRVDNNTEQYLEIELPAGAELWTTRVADEPVKPTRVAGSPTRVRLPLVKTAPGDLDYPVVVKYGGSLGPLGRIKSVQFPLIRAVNINVELSQARVFLPEEYAWFDFGGSMRQVTEAGEFEAGYLSYQTTRVERLAETLRDGNVYAKLRGASNYENLKSEITRLNRELARVAGNEELRQEQQLNVGALQMADQQLADLTLDEAGQTQTDNRARFRGHYEQQRGGRARNVVQDLAGNFPAETAKAPASGAVGGAFNDRWAGFGDESRPDATLTEVGGEGDRPGAQPVVEDEQMQVGRKGGRRAAQAPRAPEVAQRQVIDALRAQRDAEAKGDDDADALYGGDAGGKARRYQARLREKNQAGVGRSGGGGGFGGGAAPAPGSDPVEEQIAQRSDKVVGWQAGAAGPTVGAGLASVDVELPARGREYRFTTPRGEVEITARAASSRTLITLRRLGILAIAVALVLVLRRVAGGLARRASRRALSTAMILVGVTSALAGFLPIAGVTIVVIGLAMKVAARLERRLVPVS